MKHGGNVWEGGAPDKWLDFSANLRPEGPPGWVRRVMLRALEDARYYPDRCMRAARRGLAAYAGVPEENILPTAGGAAAIDLALSLRHGAVRIEEPAFGEYAARAAAQGRAVAAAEAACGPEDTRVLCNPNNPTGAALSRDEAAALYRTVSAGGGELMVDEAFIDYCPENSVRNAVDDNLTVVGSLTKILGIPGVRLGYVCAAKKNMVRFKALALPWSLNALAAAVAAELPEHLAELRADAALNAARRGDFAASLAGLGARPLPSAANFLLCDFGRDMTEAVSRLKARGILVRPCQSFGLGANWLRLAVRTEEDNKQLIGALKTCLV